MLSKILKQENNYQKWNQIYKVRNLYYVSIK